MSSGLHTLIRLHKWRLDEKRRALSELQAWPISWPRTPPVWSGKSPPSRKSPAPRPKAAFGYGNFAKQAIERRRRLAQSVAQVEHQIAEATEEMAEAFQELKRYELAQEGRDRRDEAKRKVRENAALDETALSGFMRRREP